MRIIISISAISAIFLLSYIYSISFADDNNWGIQQDIKNQNTEVSEYIWETENTNEIQSEYGSDESSYYNGRGNSSAYDDDIGGDSFDSYGY